MLDFGIRHQPSEIIEYDCVCDTDFCNFSEEGKPFIQNITMHKVRTQVLLYQAVHAYFCTL